MKKYLIQLTKKPENLWRLISLLVAIFISACAFVFREQLKNLESLGYIGIFLLSVAGNATIILPIPVFLTAFLGGTIFNPTVVGLIAATGATIGELTGYLAGLGGQAFLEDNKKTRGVSRWLNRHGLLTLFVLATLPNPFFDLAGITAGILNYPVSHFILATLAGKTVKFLVLAFLGAGSISLLD